MDAKAAACMGIEKNPELPLGVTSISILGKHGTILFLDPRRVRPLPENPHWASNPGFSEESISSLGRSIRQTGQIESAKVCLTDKEGYDAQLIDGERRLRACITAGLMLRVEVREDVIDEETLFLLSVAANFGKAEHTCLEIAHAIRRFKEEQGRDVDEIADIFGKSTPWVYSYLNILKLHPDVQQFLVANPFDPEPKGKGKRRGTVLSFSLVNNLYDLPPTEQLSLATQILKKAMPLSEARRYILKHRHETGQPKKACGRQKEQFQSLEALVSSTAHKFGIFEDMRCTDVLEFLRKHHISERRTLLKEIDTLLSSITSFRDLVHRSIES